MKLNTAREPQVIFPTQILEKKYVGELKGYFIPNTNCYNVLPFDDAANINEFNRYSVGFIFPTNPFRFVDPDIASQIKYVKLEEASPDEMMRRLRGGLTGTAQKYFNSDYLPAETARVIESMKQNGCMDRDNATELWLERIFMPQLYLDPATNLGDAAGYGIVGYWENGELYFIQMVSRRECQKSQYSLKLDVFSRNTGILESDVMLEKGAMFIGCGSVGSLFALELAKAGVGRFLLIDNDTFGYHNICRHQCGIYDVGRYKTDALADRILQINPYAKIVTKNMMIQSVPLDELYAFCDKNTIVIGGADNREGDLYANNLAQEIKMPFMSIGCWERAFAGEIFYCLPEGMPNYKDFVEVTGTISGRVNQNRQFYTTEEDLKKLTFEPGISADINFVTTIAVKMALDLLNLDNPNYTQRLVPYLTQFTLVCNTNDMAIGGEKAAIFSYPLQVTTSIIVPYSNR